MQDYISGIAPKGMEQTSASPRNLDHAERTSPAAPAENKQNTAPVERDESKPKAQVKEERSLDELAEMLRKLNLTFDLFEIEAEYSVEEDSHEIKVIIRNTRTGEIIRRIPPFEFEANYKDLKRGLGTLINASV
ncbi:flagellar protein FlaG [bacterium]|nr:flagellar protein FlaG [bacterium]